MVSERRVIVQFGVLLARYDKNISPVKVSDDETDSAGRIDAAGGVIGASRAQDSTDTAGWPVEERCVGEPTAPPEGWAWEGIIFFRDMKGIHALNPAFDKPYFILFADEFIYGASLSPDGKWYAVADGYVTYTSMSLAAYYHVTSINVYSTDGKRTLYQIPWSNVWRTNAYTPVRWIDNQHFFYPSGRGENGDMLIKANPFTKETAEYSPEPDADMSHNSFPHFPALSFDGRFRSLTSDKGLQIADLQEQRMIDTCIDIGRTSSRNLVWSFNSHQLVMNYDAKIVMLDVETGEFYILAYYDSFVIGLGAGE